VAAVSAAAALVPIPGTDFFVNAWTVPGRTVGQSVGQSVEQ